MGQTRSLAAIAIVLATAACGSAESDAPVGRTMREADASRVPAASTPGGRVDAQTMRVRRVAGTWRGGSGGERIEATFGNDGSLSVQIERDGGIVDAATGTWRLEEGLLAGSMKDGGAVLSRYAHWKGAFATDTTINLSGSDGAIMALRR